MLRNFCKHLIYLLLLVFFAGCVQQSLPTPALTESNISGFIVYDSVVNIDSHEKQIFLKDLDTGEITQLTDKGNNFTPRWSPDGEQIVFMRDSKENTIDIYLMERDGSNQRPLVVSSASERAATWSPDGKQISFVSNATGKSEIYLMDLDTHVTSRLTDSLEFAGFPAWSSYGDKIAFQSSVGGGRSQIFIMNVDGTNLEQITEYDVGNFDGIPVWCPDDSCIFFWRHEGGVDKLMLINLKSKEIISLLDSLFDPIFLIRGLTHSASREYITFGVGEKFYAMNIKTREVYSLGVGAIDLSLYP